MSSLAGKRPSRTLWDTLEAHSVLLAAPRRVGKSSLMLKLLREPKSGFDVLWLDGQDYDSPEDLVSDLAIKAAKLGGGTQGTVRRLLSRVAGNLEELEIWELKIKLREQLKDSWRVQGGDGDSRGVEARPQDPACRQRIADSPAQACHGRRREGPALRRTCWTGFGTFARLPSSSGKSGNLSAAPSGFHGSPR